MTEKAVRHSGFVIPWSLVIRHWSFSTDVSIQKKSHGRDHGAAGTDSARLDAAAVQRCSVSDVRQGADADFSGSAKRRGRERGDQHLLPGGERRASDED